MSYFNAASHGLPDPNVYTAMADFLISQSGLAQAKTKCGENEKLLDAKRAVASILSTEVDQLGFTSTTTAAWHAIVGQLDLAGKRVLVTEHEWGDFYRILAKRADITIEVLPALNLSDPNLSLWAARLDEDVAAIFVPLITSTSGARYPVEAIGLLPRSNGTKFIVDAAEALGQTPISVNKLNCDAIVSTCRKWLRGPRQTALFWVNTSWSESDEFSASSLAPADQNAALMIGLGAAAQSYLMHTPQGVEQTLRAQASDLRTWASSNGISVYGGGGGKKSQSAIVSLDLDQRELKAVTAALEQVGIVGKVIDINVVEPLNRALSNQTKILRISPHIYNSGSDLQQLKDVISGAL